MCHHKCLYTYVTTRKCAITKVFIASLLANEPSQKKNKARDPHDDKITPMRAREILTPAPLVILKLVK